jgi:predicted ArsR family transcriptional regulator
VFARLQSLRRPARAQELAEALSIHPNSVRLHLDRLAREGLVRRVEVAQDLGRPHHEWSIDPAARPLGRRPRAYADLAQWLARTLDDSVDGGHIEQVGRTIGRDLAPAGRGRPVDALEAVLASMGFQPRRAEPGTSVCFRLDNCPYRDAAERAPDVVCTLHRGLTVGLLDVLAPEAELVEFVPKDPAAAGCLLKVTEIS